MHWLQCEHILVILIQRCSMIRSYTELCTIDGFEARYEYLRTYSTVGIATFGYERWLNQDFYTSAQWRLVRQEVIARDRGCDLGVEGFEVWRKIIIHHMNPINVRSLTSGDPSILDPEYLITVSHRTHNAIHFGDSSLIEKPFVERKPGDTKLW
jgi:hypothetical protein